MSKINWDRRKNATKDLLTRKRTFLNARPGATELISNPTNGFARVADELVNLGGSRGQ